MDGARTFKEISLGYLRETRGMFVVLLLLAPPFALLLYYTSMHVETALIERRLVQLESKQESLKKKNRALRKAIAARARDGRSRRYAIPGSQRIVRIEMPRPSASE